MGGAAILDLLQHGKPLQRLITVTEGMPAIIVQEKLAANPILPGRCRRSPKARCCPTATAISAARRARRWSQRMQAAMTKAVDELWPKRTHRLPDRDARSRR